MSRRPGFTLLEVVVAMAILGLSLMAIFRLNSGAVAMHVYAKHLVVATQLARSKMTDLQQELYDKGFSVDDQEESGDFSEAGSPSFKWRARILAPRTEGVSPERVMQALFNVPADMGSLSALFGGDKGAKGSDSSSSGGPTALGPGMTAAAGAGAMGPMAGLVQGQLAQMLQQISQSVREVRLTVSWKDGKQVESVDLVTHVVSLGAGSDRNGVMGVPMAGGLPGQAVVPGVPGGPGTLPSINPGFPQGGFP